jgi:hypothetical protein
MTMRNDDSWSLTSAKGVNMTGPIDIPNKNIATGRRLSTDETPNSSTSLYAIGAAILEHIATQLVSTQLGKIQ